MLKEGGICIVRIAKLLMLSTIVASSALGAAAAGEARAALVSPIAPMPLNRALEQFAKQTGLQVVYVSTAATGVESAGAPAGLSRDATLRALLSGTGLQSRFIDENTVTISKPVPHAELPMHIAQAAPPRASVETVTVTSSKLGGADVQSVPIAITALSQEQLTATQTAGGPDLVKQVPNLTFTKTNFTGYSIQIRGIGTQAISVTTDPAVAVAFNDMPFIRNHFFEQEFYDVSQVEILRGPQGTLYGRNATAGVVNLISAKPSDQFEAMASGELGNYHQRRFEGMINIPIVDDRLDVRLAGEWTKRQGYSFNDSTNQRIDGRDLWSARATIGWKPSSEVQAYLVWEHFSENDDRIRSSKQLCKTAPIPSEVGGKVIAPGGNGVFGDSNLLSQGCEATSLYSPEAFQVPNGFTLPYVTALAADVGQWDGVVDPYASISQSRNLRVIQSQLDPTYRSQNDIVQLNVDYTISPALTFTSQTGFNHDFLWSTQDYHRLDTAPGLFDPNGSAGGNERGQISADRVFCDPQLGCSDRLIAEDLSKEHAWQLNQEFRVASHFSGPFNFSLGGNYMHYETEENYYVFINSLTLFSSVGPPAGIREAMTPWVPGVSDNRECLKKIGGNQYPDPRFGGAALGCVYIDPNPITSLNDKGHNYFLSQNPYLLDSYAAFGEAYYNVTSDLKLTGGLRWTDDRKHFPLIPSWLVSQGYGYPVTGVVDQEWSELTGRAAVNWSPKLDFTDQTLFYGSYAHGYKAGGANPPGAMLALLGDNAAAQPTHPLTFKPEFIDAFEVGSKNTLFDGALTLNGNVFYYNYENYQISQIVDRTAVNLNFDAHIKGAELEAMWEPLPGFRLNFAGGYEDARLAKGSKAIDLMDRTAGNPDWIVIKPFVTYSSNCIVPRYLFTYGGTAIGNHFNGLCADAYQPVAVGNGTNQTWMADPITQVPYVKDPYGPGNYPGFDALSVDPNAPADVNNGLGLPPNGGAGFDKDLSGNRLPNAPPFTLSAGAQYSVPLTSDWAGTLRADFYWQDNSWWRVFNDNQFDKLHGYTNLNLTLILTSQNGWQVMLYDKNVFNTTAITGAFLNSDDSGLTTNVFLTDPKLIGVRVTKNW